MDSARARVRVGPNGLTIISPERRKLCPVCRERAATVPIPPRGIARHNRFRVCLDCAARFAAAPSPDTATDTAGPVTGRPAARRAPKLAPQGDGLCHCSDYASVEPHARVIVCQPLRAARAYKAPQVLAGQLRMGG